MRAQKKKWVKSDTAQKGEASFQSSLQWKKGVSRSNQLKCVPEMSSICKIKERCGLAFRSADLVIVRMTSVAGLN